MMVVSLESPLISDFVFLPCTGEIELAEEMNYSALYVLEELTNDLKEKKTTEADGPNIYDRSFNYTELIMLLLLNSSGALV